MGKLLLVLAVCFCLSCKAQLPVVPLALLSASSINVTNIPTVIGGLEHRWKAVDLPAGRVFAPNYWTDEVQSAWVWFTNVAGVGGTAPTNGVDGLRFAGSQTMSLSNNGPNYLQFPSSGTIKRSFCFIYSTADATKQGLLTREFIAGQSGGLYINASGNGVSTAGRFCYHEEGSSEELSDGLKTDGTLQDIMAVQTTIASPSHATGYTNGTAALSIVGVVNYQMGGLGNGFANFNGKLVELLVYTNWSLSDAALAATNHYYRTNCYGGSP